VVPTEQEGRVGPTRGHVSGAMPRGERHGGRCDARGQVTEPELAALVDARHEYSCAACARTGKGYGCMDRI